jgi:hypothetical protein
MSLSVKVQGQFVTITANNFSKDGVVDIFYKIVSFIFILLTHFSILYKHTLSSCVQLSINMDKQCLCRKVFLVKLRTWPHTGLSCPVSQVGQNL